MRSLIRAFDAQLRRRSGAYEFSDDPECLLRLQIGRMKRPCTLPDMEIREGDPVLRLHLWNEQVPRLASHGPDMAWATQMHRQFLRSLRAVAAEIERDPRLTEIVAVGGGTGVFGPTTTDSGNRVFSRLGFTIFPYRGLLGRFGEFWENVYSWWLMWTFNATSLRSREFLRVRRSEMWISRQEFLRRFGAAGPV